MWEITTAEDTRRVFTVGIGETFEGLSDEEKKIVYESSEYLKDRIELELNETVGEICRLADSLTEDEWSNLPASVYYFLRPYKQVEEDD